MNNFDEIKKLATADGLRLICHLNADGRAGNKGNTGILIKDNCFSSVKNSAAIAVNLIAPDFNAEYQRAKKGLMEYIDKELLRQKNEKQRNAKV